MTKRRRKNANADAIERTPHEILWPEDGDIALLAGNVVMKAHISVLIAHAEVFRLALDPERLENGERYEGLPLVRLRAHPEDGALLLLAMYGQQIR